MRNIYLYNPLNGSKRKLYTTSASSSIYDKLYKGHTIFYIDLDANNYQQIYSLHIPSQQVTQLTTSNQDSRILSYSSHTNSLYYSSTQANNNNEIFRLNLEALDVQQITHNNISEFCLSLSLNDEFIAFLDSPSYALYIVKLDGSDERLITSEGISDHPVFSRNGEWLYYWHDKTGITYGNFNDDDMGEIYRVNLATYEIENMTNNPASDGIDQFSPDGEWLLFGSTRNGNDNDLYKMRLDGSNMQKLTTSSADELGAIYSPDGKWIIYHTNQDIYRMRPDGSDKLRLTNTNHSVAYGGFANNEQFLFVYYGISPERRIERIDLESGEILNTFTMDFNYLIPDQVSIDKTWHPNLFAGLCGVLLLGSGFLRLKRIPRVGA